MVCLLPSWTIPSPTAIARCSARVSRNMAKDSIRFADSGGWGYGAFMYEKASDDWRPFTADDTPPQEHDAKCGFACHTVVQNRDYVFTNYACK